MSIKKFYDELRAGLKAPVYLFTSEDPFLLKEAELSVKGSIPEAERDFLFHTFDMDPPEQAPSVERVLDALNTVPFFRGKAKQVVAVENAQKVPNEEAKKLAAYIAEPSPYSVLVLLHAGAVKKALAPALKGAKAFALDIREGDFPVWIREKAAAKGLVLTREAVDYLMGTFGPDAGLLSSEIEKLSLAGKGKLDAGEVSEIVKGPGGYDVFDLIAALRAKKPDRVFKIYRALSETQEPHALLGALNWHYGRAATGREEKARVFGLLNEADFMIKSSGGAFPVEYLLVRLLQS
ncbi:MAG: DNA polymerase III subunit delta [Thermodesulfovibrionales bacterium]